jgi:hypothetical protein
MEQDAAHFLCYVPQMSFRGIAAVSTGTACLLLLSGCGGKVVSKSTVESQVAKELAAEVHQPQPKVVCPDDLKAKVNASMICVLTPSGQTTTYNVTVTVTSVTNGVAHFHAVVASSANPASGG